MLAVQDQLFRKLRCGVFVDTAHETGGKLHVGATGLEKHENTDGIAERNAGEQASDSIGVPLPIALKVGKTDLSAAHVSHEVAKI